MQNSWVQLSQFVCCPVCTVLRGDTVRQHPGLCGTRDHWLACCSPAAVHPSCCASRLLTGRGMYLSGPGVGGPCCRRQTCTHLNWWLETLFSVTYFQIMPVYCPPCDRKQSLRVSRCWILTASLSNICQWAPPMGSFLNALVKLWAGLFCPRLCSVFLCFPAFQVLAQRVGKGLDVVCLTLAWSHFSDTRWWTKCRLWRKMSKFAKERNAGLGPPSSRIMQIIQHK